MGQGTRGACNHDILKQCLELTYPLAWIQGTYSVYMHAVFAIFWMNAGYQVLECWISDTNGKTPAIALYGMLRPSRRALQPII